MNLIPNENEIEEIINKVVTEVAPVEIKTLTNVIFLVQVLINNDNNLELYIVSDALIPEYVLLIVNMNYYLQGNSNNDNNTISVRTYFTYEKVESGHKERLICYTSDENEFTFHDLVDANIDKITFKVTNIERDYFEDSIISNYYNFVTYYFNNTGTDKKDIYNYTGSNIKIRMFKIKAISTSTKEWEVNLTLNNKFEGKNIILMLEFNANYTENKIPKNLNNKAEWNFNSGWGKMLFIN